MINNNQSHNFMWACGILNLTPPQFTTGMSYEQAADVLDHFKKLAKSKFRKVILAKHVDKGGDRVVTENLIEANRIVKEAIIQRPQPVVQYVRVMSYTYASSAGGTTSGISW